MLRNLAILKYSLLMALQELRTNKMRTFLSLLGVTIGIFCVVSVRTLTKSLEMNVREDMASLGNNVVFIQRWPWSGAGGDWWKFMQRPKNRIEEFRQLENRLHNVAAMAYVYDAGGKTIEYGDAYMKGATMMGMTDEFDDIQDLHIAAGRFFSQAEASSSSPTIILGANIWEGLFPSASSALEKEVRLEGTKYIVIGALEEYGNDLVGGFDYDNSVLLPYNAALRIVNDQDSDPYIMVKPAEGESSAALQEEIRGAMRAIRQLQPTEDDNFALNEMSMMAASTEQIFGKLNLGGMCIGIFALLVGAFGIANIMFVTVKERTHIIGLKKAIGAKRSVILQEFLIEAVILCLIGGLIGMLLVYLVTQAISSFVFFKVYMTAGIVFFSILISVITGIIAGLIPALSASKLDPVVAIRS